MVLNEESRQCVQISIHARCRLACGEPSIDSSVGASGFHGKTPKLGAQMENEQWRNMLRSYMINAQKRHTPSVI